MTRKYDVITVGTARLDAFMTVHDESKMFHLDPETNELRFKHGEKIIVEKYDFCLGGNAANVAVGICRLGLKATIVAEMGDDEFSIKIRNTLAKENVERLFVVQTKGGSSNLSVIINFKGERTIFAEERVQEHNFHLSEAEAEYVYLTSLGREWERPYEKILDYAKKHDIKIAFNPGRLQLEEGKELIKKVFESSQILFVNKEEAESILFGEKYDNSSNEHDYIKDLLSKLNELGPSTVVITNGNHGSMVLDSAGNYYYQGMHPGRVVERTGAGDAYATGFLAATIQGLTVEQAMDWGSTNAASVVGKVGAQAGLLTKTEIEESVKED